MPSASIPAGQPPASSIPPLWPPPFTPGPTCSSCPPSQMIAMRYGTIPIVRETGGLKDTVTPYVAGTGEGRGFTFANIDADDMLYVIRQAIDAYQNKQAWQELMRRDMTADFTWDRSAGAYGDIYRELTEDRQ